MRRSFSKIALAAGFALALAFTFGCSSGNDDDGSGTCNGGTVKIGTQTWQKCNLNVVPTSANGAATNSACYNKEESNCAIYGRLYDWATAMAFPDSCNIRDCSDQIQQKHRGICPSGWHIPSNADWNALMKYVNPNCEDDSDCAGAGTKLKAASGWNDYEGKSGNGTDNYGFSALPGGEEMLGFKNVGKDGFWWSASESNYWYTHSWNIFYGSEDVYHYNGSTKNNSYSVRCLQDD